MKLLILKPKRLLFMTQTDCYTKSKYVIIFFRAQQFCSQNICSGFEKDKEIYEDLNDDGNILIHPYTILFNILGLLTALLMVAVKIGHSRLTLKIPQSGIGISAPKNLESMGLNLTLVVILAISVPCSVYLNK